MPQVAFLRNRFDLTPTEARVVLRPVTGDTLQSAANVLGIKYETVRGHLKSVFKKTGVCRQAELVIVVIRAMNQNGLTKGTSSTKVGNRRALTRSAMSANDRLLAVQPRWQRGTNLWRR